ncbi:MAG: fructosamine kinase family protein [Herminiimonas sp.]|jgi:hypothetical protein|nr:fructosamine kinase family protein [Herminiimonas sp.]
MIMDHQRVDYKGHVILPMPACEKEGRCYGGYEISKDGEVISVRKNIFPGFFYLDAAVEDSVEHAKLEIDSLVAAKGSSS